MAERVKGAFVHREFKAAFQDLKLSDPSLPMVKRAVLLRKEVNRIADEQVTHPLIVVKEMRLAEVDNALKAQETIESRTSQYAYVSDIHGLDDRQFAKLRDSLTRGSFDQVFFVGDVGGSEMLGTLQRYFYQGENSLTGKVGWNRYRELQKEGADDARILAELRSGYKNLYQYVKILESHNRMSEEEAKEMAEKLTDEEVLNGIKWVGKHKHYGHFVSDTKGGMISGQVIETLAADVESYYERFAHLVADIQLNSKARVHVLQGNWDARLPFDFKAGTEEPEVLDSNRRFDDKKFYEKMGIHYFTNAGIIDTGDAVHIMVPFDAVAREIGSSGALLTERKVKELELVIKQAKADNKNVVMVAHAVPSWEMHNKPSTGEGQTTEKYLRALIARLEPHQIIYGHEHAIRKDATGQPFDLDTRYRILTDGDEVIISIDNEELKDLDKRSDGTVAVHEPIPAEPFNGIATLEIAKRSKDKRSRGNGGKNSPIRVGRPSVPLKDISVDLPTEKILVPTTV